MGNITAPNPTQYPNINLFFTGHLDSDMINEVEILTDPATGKLTESFIESVPWEKHMECPMVIQDVIVQSQV